MRFCLPILAVAGLLLAAGPLAAQERWQLTLADGSYLYELRPVALDGDSLVIELQGGRRALALAELHELREVRPVLQPAGTRRGILASLTGADDRVYVLGYLPLEERRAVVRQIVGRRALRATPGVGTPTEWGSP